MISKRRAHRALGPWLLLGIGVWLAFDNGPALVDELRLRDAVTGSATVLTIGGGRPVRAVRRFWDDYFWGRGRRISYRLAIRDAQPTTASTYVTHDAADTLREGSTVRVRYDAADPSVHRIDGEASFGRLVLRLVLAAGLAVLGIVWLLRRRAPRGERSASVKVTA